MWKSKVKETLEKVKSKKKEATESESDVEVEGRKANVKNAPEKSKLGRYMPLTLNQILS